MARYLITGGAGFIGTNLAKKLIEAGHQVVSVDNYVAGRFPERVISGVEYIEGDIRDFDFLLKTFMGVDGVFHMAAVPRMSYSVEYPLETNEVNVVGTLNVLLAARDAGVKRVVYSASSSAVGGAGDDSPMTEDIKTKPLSPYGLQKLIGEHYARLFSELYNLETVSLRYFNVYGRFMDPNGAYALVIGKFLKQRKNGEPMTICGDGEYYRDYTHVEDVARANLLAMESKNVGKGEVINIGNGHPYSVNDLVKLIDGEAVNVPPRPGDPRRTEADNILAKKLLDWSPSIKLPDGIASLKKEWGID